MIPIQSQAEIPPYNVSKWLKLPLYLTLEEMKDFLERLPSFFVPMGGVIPKDQTFFDKTVFLEMYRDYIEALRRGIRRPAIDKRLYFAISDDLSSFRGVDVDKGVLLRVVKPVIQVQPYTLNFSEASGKFYELTFGPDSFYWGLCFSLPQLYQNPKTNDVEKVFEVYPKIGDLFKTMQKWSREHTIPTPFKIQEKIIHYPARIGKGILQEVKWLYLPQK